MMNLSKIGKDDKFFFLAYDQGLEHGPVDFNLTTANPEYIFDLTKSGIFTAVIVQKGLAEKYYKPEIHKTPLIIKLNGKTQFIHDEPYSPQICSVDEAVRLRAKAVAYTVYVGSKYEAKMFKEFSNIVYEAHDLGIPVIGWMHPRGIRVGEETTDVTAYAARVGLELGADMVKVKYATSPDAMQWVVACAGMMPVCVAGDAQKQDTETVKDVLRGAMTAGCKGAVFGKSIWQDPNPLERAQELADIIFTS